MVTSDNKKYLFIHTPKTGGTALEEYFQSYYSDYIIGFAHDNICSDNENSIIIIRNPIDRFLSLYSYQKYGSERFNLNRQYNNYSNINTISDFISYIDSSQLPVNSFVWPVHYDEQVNWIKPTDYKSTIILIYENNLNKKYINYWNI